MFDHGPCDFVKIKRQMNLFIFSCSPKKERKIVGPMCYKKRDGKLFNYTMLVVE